MDSRILLAIIAGILYWWGQNQVGYCFLEAFSWSPLMHGVVYGIVTGRMSECLIIGSAIFTLYISLVAAGGNTPADSTAAGSITIPIALLNNMETEAAVTLAIAVALIGNVLQPIQFNLANITAHVADKYAAAGDYKGIYRSNFLNWLFVFIIRFPVAFAAVYFGASAIDVVIAAIPEWLMHGLEVSGGVLPAMGIAVTLHVINKQQYLPLYLIGYFFVVIFGVSVLAASIFGIGGVVLYTVLSLENDQLAAAAANDED